MPQLHELYQSNVFFFQRSCTIPETNSQLAPENRWLDFYLCGPAHFQGLVLAVGFREGS